MLRRADDQAPDPDRRDCGKPLRVLTIPGFRVSEAVNESAQVVPARPSTWASLCLTVEGSYQLDWGRKRLRCGAASLVFHAPGDVYGARVSDAGCRCMMVAVDPTVLSSAADTLPDLGRLNGTRHAPHWLAFQLRQELEVADDLSSESVPGIVFALLTELGGRPGLQARNGSPPWLERVREQIDDEFRRHHTLEDLARAAGVHRVHLAREFRRRFGCTVGHYVRQRRVEFACHRLTVSRDSLAEIAFTAGFADQSHFTNTFRRLIGVSPGAFRARFLAPPRHASAN